MVDRVHVIVDRGLEGDRAEVEEFIERFGSAAELMIDDQPVDRSARVDEVRASHVKDALVTLVLNGRVTHASADVDRKLLAALTPAPDGWPNGLLGCTLDRSAQKFDLPPRLSRNVESGYARFYRLPLDVAELTRWLTDASRARTERRDLVEPGAEPMMDNREPAPTWSPFVADDGRPRQR